MSLQFGCSQNVPKILYKPQRFRYSSEFFSRNSSLGFIRFIQRNILFLILDVSPSIRHLIRWKIKIRSRYAQISRSFESGGHWKSIIIALSSKPVRTKSLWEPQRTAEEETQRYSYIQEFSTIQDKNKEFSFPEIAFLCLIKLFVFQIVFLLYFFYNKEFWTTLAWLPEVSSTR